MDSSFPLRNECPPGACNCGRAALLAQPGADVRVLLLTREEEKRLVARLEAVTSLPELRRMQERMQAQLGIVLTLRPSSNEVRTLRGIQITLQEQPGLCRKTRQTLPAAVRKSMDNRPEIVFALLDEQGLLGGPLESPDDSRNLRNADPV